MHRARIVSSGLIIIEHSLRSQSHCLKSPLLHLPEHQENTSGLHLSPSRKVQPSRAAQTDHLDLEPRPRTSIRRRRETLIPVLRSPQCRRPRALHMSFDNTLPFSFESPKPPHSKEDKSSAATGAHSLPSLDTTITRSTPGTSSTPRRTHAKSAASDTYPSAITR